VASYWLFCLLAVELFVACWLVWLDRPQSSLELVSRVMQICALPFAGSLLLIPLVVFDMVRFSHRFAGPMVRLRRGMNELAEGQPTPHVIPRDGDFWRDFAEDYNRVVDRVEQLEAQLRTAQHHPLEPSER
jgi:hypothetical protein